MATRCGDTLLFAQPPVIAARAAIGGKKESLSPLAGGFDELYSDNFFGQKSWEAAETELALRTARLCLKKAGTTEKQVSLPWQGICRPSARPATIPCVRWKFPSPVSTGPAPPWPKHWPWRHPWRRAAPCSRCWQ